MANNAKFAQMSTKKLLALRETASEEDAVAIDAILESRNQMAQGSVPQVETTELSEEEKQAIAAAEKAAGADTSEQAASEAGKPEAAEKKKAGRKPSQKLSEEELNKAKEEADKNIGHRCSAFLPGTTIRVDGTVYTTLKDKRAMQVYYQIQTDALDDMESRKIYKKFNAEDLQIFDEVVEMKKKPESKARVAKQKMDAGEWEKEAEAVRVIAEANIGKAVQVSETATGRVINILNDKRSGGMYYRIEFLDENGVKKICHRVINYSKDENGAIVLAEFVGMAAELDEEGKQIHDAYVERKSREPRKVLTPEEKVLACEEAVKKAEASLLKAQETLETRKTALATAKAELNNKFDNQAERAGANAGDEELA